MTKQKETFFKQVIYYLAFFSSVIYILYRIFFTIPSDSFTNIFFAILILLLEIAEAGVYSIYVFDVLLFKKDSLKTPHIKKEEYPEMDIFIATINEEVELLEETIQHCLDMKYPDKKKLHFYLCDDGRRSEMKKLCKKMKINYIDRKDNKDAKAGNYNHALEVTKSPYIAVFDADMHPTKDFLMKTVPHLVANKDVGFVQIPQNFRNPDIYQSRYKLLGKIPFEQDYFFNKIQMAKNYTNSVIYCGTNTVFLRKALVDAGGFATQSVTEDIATGIMIEANGYRGVGLPVKEAFGLNVNNLDSYIKQKSRWCRGCIQTFKNYNILGNKGLTFRQKADYFSTLFYWTYGIRQIFYMIIPLLFPFFQIHMIRSNILIFSCLFFIQYILKRFVVDIMEDRYSSSTWNRIYETILFPTIALDIIREVSNLGSNKFFVSPKKKEKNTMTPKNLYLLISHLVFFILTLIGLVISISRSLNYHFTVYLIPVFWLASNLFYLTFALIFDLSMKEVEEEEVKTRCDHYSLRSILLIGWNFMKEELGLKKSIMGIGVIILAILSIFGVNHYQKGVVHEKMSHNWVSDNGWLHIDENKIVNEKNEIVHLRGVNSHSPYWYEHNYTYENLKNLKETWGINVFRIAMYTNPDIHGYVGDEENQKEIVNRIVEYCIDLDIYVILDWHILKDNNPMTYKEEAKAFFQEMSLKYKDVPNVLYEICNEPSGEEVTWNDVIKPYAEEVIPVIRENSPNSIVIVGTANWCKDTGSVIANPLEQDNIIYAVHTYMGDDIYTVDASIKLAIKKKLPIFVTECAATDGTGDGRLYFDFFEKWVDYLEENQISWILWQFSDKPETSSLIIAEETKKLEWHTKGIYTEKELEHMKYDLNDYLSETGKVSKRILLKYSLS